MRKPSKKFWTRLFFLLITILLAADAAVFFFIFKQQKKPYNLIFISIDTLRADHMSLYGYPKKTTPSLDDWAKQNGVIFTNAYTQVPITFPSFASTMTGLSPYQTGIYNNGKVKEGEGQLYHEAIAGNQPIDASVPTLAGILKSNGYTTGAYVINNVLGAKITGLNRGFDDYNIAGDNYHFSGIPAFLSDVQSWLDDKTQLNNPFFLWVHFLDPHEPFTPIAENECRFAGDNCDEIKQHPMDYFTNQQKNLEGCQSSPLPEKTVSTQEALYDAELYQTDSYVGRILDYIKANQLDKNTIIVFFADHGEGFDHNYYFTHSEMLYESSVRIPYVISFPSTLGKSRVVPSIINNTQTMSTVLSLLGFSSSIPSGQKSFANILTQTPQIISATDPLFYVNESGTKFAVRKGEWKYITTHVKPGDRCAGYPTEELYNVSIDTKESKNLVAQHPEIVAHLRQLLIAHLSNSRIVYTKSDSSKIATPSAKTDKHEQEILRNLKSLGY